MVEHFIDIEGVAGSIPASRTHMTFEEYQKESRRAARYPDVGHTIIYPTLGIAGETGEVVEKVKKILRDKNNIVSEETRAAVAKEMGDVLWYLAQLATELDISLESVASGNLEKVLSRLERGVIHGDGDER